MKIIKWLSFALYAIGCVVAWPQLPGRIPYHFDFAGNANAWTDNVAFAWFGLPLLALVMVVLLSAIMKLTPRAPQLWNVPEKQRFLAMSEEQRQPIYNELARLMDGTAAGSVVLFAAIQYGMFAVATGRAETLPTFVTYLTFGFILAVLVSALALNRKIKQLILSA